MPQLHRATDALVESWRLPLESRRDWLTHAAAPNTHWQVRNQQPRIHHTHARLKQLELTGLSVDQLQRCRPG